jgi:hypothetical protein
MCVICTLPTTHAGTFSTISMVSLFLLVFWTFVSAWWLVSKIKIEDYFVTTFRAVLKVRKVGYKKTVHRIFLFNNKSKILSVLLLVSVSVLFWAALNDIEEFSNIELLTVDPYLVVPTHNTQFLSTEILQIQYSEY